MKGDFIVSARVAFVGKGVDAHRKIGWMVRGSTWTRLRPRQRRRPRRRPDLAPVPERAGRGDGRESAPLLRRRPGPARARGSALHHVGGAVRRALRRAGERRRYSTSATKSSSASSSVRTTPTSSERARFTNVRITVPAPADFVPYRTTSAGRSSSWTSTRGGARRSSAPTALSRRPTGRRTAASSSITPTGFSTGSSWRRARRSKLDTGFATANNNDHVLSFDGKRLGISDHSAEDGDESVVYTLPVTGGTPKRITPKAPSYLHGWSPDGRFLVYTGGRSGNYDIYRIAVGGRRRGPPDRCPGPRRRPRVLAGRPLHLFQLRPDGRICRSGG